jgi:hypothetical protein
MKTATALVLVAVGAILAFAVTAQPSFFSFHVTGWVLMLTGAAGAVMTRRGYGWMRRKPVLSTGDSRRKELDIRQRRYSRLLVPGGILGEAGLETPVSAQPVPVESEMIEEYIEE